MRVCGIDIETTGLSFKDDHVTEIAWVIKDTGDAKPLWMASEFCKLPEGVTISPEIFELTKITRAHCDWGKPVNDVVTSFYSDLVQYHVDYIVAHNGSMFDKPFLEEKCGGGLIGHLPWIDTATDVPYPATIKNRNLTYLAASHGFLNPFPHAALMDVMTMLKILDFYDFFSVLKRAKSPWVFLQADVSYDNREEAKKRGFSWEKHWSMPDVTYPKKWVKRLKECDLEQYPFDVKRL